MTPKARLFEEWCGFLRRIPLFSELEEDALRGVARKLQPLAMAKGSALYNEGDVGDALYIVLTGRVSVMGRDEQGKETVLNYLGRGETFGETSLLTGAPHSVTVKSDAASTFLVLQKNDFEAFLKRNPAASFYLSRMVSQRLLMASRHVPEARSMPSQLLGFICDLPREDHAVFMINLCLSVTEQTRRRTLLLELGPHGSDIVKAMGLQPISTTAKMLHSQDLQDPKIIQRMAVAHPSGLEILTLPEDIFSGLLFRSIAPFMDTLRQLYDFVIVDTHGMPTTAHPSAPYANSVAQAFLQECQTLYAVHATPLTSREEFLQSLLQESKPLHRVVLGGQASMLLSQADFIIPWSAAVSAQFLRGGHPYLTGQNAEASQRMVDRLARFIGKRMVGLACGSGAAYGYTFIGILKVLEREKIPIDFISGTSMGALLGSFAALGKSAAEIEEISLGITKIWLRRNMLSDLNLPWPHGGILEGLTISKFLRKILGEAEFHELPTPFGCVATDIVTGDPVVLRDGKVWQAVRGSLSLPIVFQPYKHNNRFLVDGGLVNPVPTSVIASMGADVLISINLTGKVSEKKVSLRRLGMFPASSPGMFSILMKMIYTMQYQVVASRADMSHVMLQPDTRNFSWVDFHKAKQIIPLGIETAEEALPKIKAQLPFFNDYCRVPLRRSHP